MPSIIDIIRTRVLGYAARLKKSNGPDHHPPSSFTGFGGGAPVTNTRRSSLVEEDEEPIARSSIDSIAAEVQESLRKSSTRFDSAGGWMEQQSRESGDDYNETGRCVSLASLPPHSTEMAVLPLHQKDLTARNELWGPTEERRS